ncbi:MAG: hypothetical protein JJE22_12760 [Bacteroidia bacterium]|nr:hypothetical protein [Bacteroidia bacterium]
MQNIKCFLLFKDCGRITAHINSLPDHGLYYQIAIFNAFRNPQPKQEGYIILSASEMVDNIVLQYEAQIERGVFRENLREMPDAFEFIYGDKKLLNNLEYLIPNAPSTAYIEVKTGQLIFKAYNIDDSIETNSPGVYLFTILVKESKEGISYNRGIIISFSSVKTNNEEIIDRAKGGGAKYFYYYYESSEEKREQIINEIKEGSLYQQQIKDYPETA